MEIKDSLRVKPAFFKKWALFFMCIGGMVFGCGGDSKSDEGVSTVTTGSSSRGKSLYLTNCAGCHGDDAKGDYAPNLLQTLHESDESLTQTITNGKGDGMPAFDEDLDSQQILDILSWLRSQG